MKGQDSGRENSPSWEDVDADGLLLVTDPDQAKILTDPHQVQFLSPFLGRSCSVSEAADEVGCSLNSMLYRVRRMQTVGLLEVVERRRRAGRAIKVYRSSAPGYRVPMASMRYDDIRHRVEAYAEPVADHLISSYTSMLFQSDDHDRIVARTAQGAVSSIDRLPSKARTGEPAFYRDVAVPLSASQAQRIRELLQEAAEEAHHGAVPQEGGRAAAEYLFIGALLPSGR